MAASDASASARGVCGPTRLSKLPDGRVAESVRLTGAAVEREGREGRKGILAYFASFAASAFDRGIV